MTGPDTAAAPLTRFRRAYGASPWHLLVLLACFALGGYAASRLLGNASLLRIALWFVGAALVWDLLLGPAYALADRALRPLRRVGPLPVGVLNHVRVPALVSSLLLLMWAPVIFQRSEPTFRVKAGLSQDVFLERWLAVTAALFALSGLVLAVRLVRARRRSRGVAEDAGPSEAQRAA